MQNTVWIFPGTCSLRASVHVKKQKKEQREILWEEETNKKGLELGRDLVGTRGDVHVTDDKDQNHGC